MDPNATLERMRSIADNSRGHDLDEMIELFQALDDWLSRGGFLPREWNTPGAMTTYMRRTVAARKRPFTGE
jgi:hypothetical protein